ncbi:MAG: 4-hydroxy-tetrahydrodipicolinate reductase [Alphaproteobacteria bacterium]|nr:4-hydroxy-tetrahydrodipicolinate reductase [Alphaproteobacteria bacterium]
MNIVVAGAAGRMGQMLVAEVAETEACHLRGATEPEGSPALGADPGVLAGAAPTGLAIQEDPAGLIAAADVVIDFTTPQATVAHARLAAQAGTALVVGTTGLSAEDENSLSLAARHVPVVYAANYSPGVTLLLDLVKRAAAALDADYDIDILEMHHRHKVDAPSGTALALGKAAAVGRGVDHETVKQTVRSGQTGARPRGEIGYATLRGGDVVGEHDVIFATEGERLTLSHKASARRVFAAGAVKAALWTAGKHPGLYDMRDVLGLRREAAETIPDAERHL